MKKKGAKFLKKHQVAAEPEEEDKTDTDRCAFCSEVLSVNGFVEKPYGNFIFAQKSKLLAHSVKQTVEMQAKSIKAIRND